MRQAFSQLRRNGGVVDSFNPTTKTQAALTSALQAATAAGNPRDHARPSVDGAAHAERRHRRAPTGGRRRRTRDRPRPRRNASSTGCPAPAAPTRTPQLSRESLAAITAAQHLATEMDDEYVSTEHLLVGLATGDSRRRQAAHRPRRVAAGAARGVHQGARQRPRHQPRPRGHLPGAGEVLHRPDRAPPAKASSTRSSGATTRFVASSRC